LLNKLPRLISQLLGYRAGLPLLQTSGKRAVELTGDWGQLRTKHKGLLAGPSAKLHRYRLRTNSKLYFEPAAVHEAQTLLASTLSRHDRGHPKIMSFLGKWMSFDWRVFRRSLLLVLNRALRCYQQSDARACRSMIGARSSSRLSVVEQSVRD
jgi:hypothetical protein